MDAGPNRELSPSPPNSLFYSLVIPAYNESKNIDGTLDEFASALREASIPFELVVVDDNSTDDTPAVLEAAYKRIPELRPVTNDGLRGFGRAVRCGLKQARGDAIALVMADHSDSAEDVIRCYRVLEEGYDCAFGSRFMKESTVKHYPLVKWAVNRVVNTLIRGMFLTGHNDMTNAFKVYRRHVIESISPLHAAHFNITIEMSLSAHIRKYRIATIPISWSGRTWGSSNLRLKEMGRRYLATLLKIWFERLLILDDVILDSESRLERGERDAKD